MASIEQKGKLSESTSMNQDAQETMESKRWYRLQTDTNQFCTKSAIYWKQDLIDTRFQYWLHCAKAE
jgi:hypothetical protein